MMKTLKNVAMVVLFSISFLYPVSVKGQVFVSQRKVAKLAVPSSTSVPYKEYVHGDPSDEEQLLLEYTNRCRANPYADMERMINSNDTHIQNAFSAFNVSIPQLRSEFSQYSSKPPLAFNPRLINCARNHSTDMAANNFQGHTSSNGSTLGQRLVEANYDYHLGGENVFSYSYSAWHAHAAFIIDWGVEDLGHRVNILNLGANTAFREIGIGTINENNSATQVGPLVITQNFGLDNDQVVFITGVAYKDNNKNSFYNTGEGLSGVQIMPNHGDYYAVSSTSGGFTIPVAINSGTYTLSVTRSDLSTMEATVQVGSENVKVDFLYNSNNPKGTITGKVTDASSNPVASVIVQLSPSGLTATTASDGSFAFADLEAGSYTLTASLDGYTITPTSTAIALVPGQVFNIELEAQSETAPPDGIDILGGCGPIGMVLTSLIAMACMTLTALPRKKN
jgi:uncharacterized protein YkwD